MLAARSLPPVLAAVGLVAATAAAGVAFVITHVNDDSVCSCAPAPSLVVTQTEAPAVPPRAPYVAEVIDEKAHAAGELDDGQMLWIVGADRFTYVQLAPAGDVPTHNPRFLQHEPGEGVQVAVADLRDKDVPDDIRAWKNKEVVAPESGCRAHITGFAVYASLSGSPSYAGIDGDNMPWTLDAVLHSGSPTIVGILDNCAGDSYARDASKPAVFHPTIETNDALTTAATRDFLATPQGIADLAMHAHSLSLSSQPLTALAVSTRVVLDTRSATRLVIVHAEQEGNGCGDPDEFRTTAIYKDLGDGALARVYLGDTMFDTAGQIVDLDGDGELEVISEGSVSDLHGEPRSTRSGGQWFGCPC